MHSQSVEKTEILEVPDDDIGLNKFLEWRS